MTNDTEITIPAALLGELLQVANLSRAYAMNFAPAFAPSSKAGEAMRAVEGGAVTIAKASELLKSTIQTETNA